MYFMAHRRDGLTMTAHIRQADAREQTRSAHREIVNIAATRATAGARVEHTLQAGELDPFIDRTRATPHLSAREARRGLGFQVA